MASPRHLEEALLAFIKAAQQLSPTRSASTRLSIIGGGAVLKLVGQEYRTTKVRDCVQCDSHSWGPAS